MPYNPAIPLLSLYPDKIIIQKDTFIAALFTIAKTGKQPKCPSADEQIFKNVIHIYNGTLHSKKKKNEIMAFAATWMDLEIIILSEVRQKMANII